MRRAALLLVLAACRSTSIVPDEPPRARRDVPDAGIVSTAPPPGDAGTISEAPKTRFVRVAHGPWMRIGRATAGPVLAWPVEMPTLWWLDPFGEPHVEQAFAKHVLPRSHFPLQIASISGRWPVLAIEMMYTAGRNSGSVHDWIVDCDKITAKRTNRHVIASSPWLEGVELGWAADVPPFGGTAFAGGSFVALAGKPPSLPKMPEGAGAISPSIAAYPSGRILFGRTANGIFSARDDADVWSVQGSDVQKLKVPGDLFQLVRGRREDETLAWGRRTDDTPWLARFDGKTFAQVALPFSRGIGAVSIGDDGSVWVLAEAARALPPKTGDEPSLLLRASFPELRFTPVPLPDGVDVEDVVAITEGDTWLVASPSDKRRQESVIFHTQARPPAAVAELEVDPAAMGAKK